MTDTIAAIATAPGRAGVAVVRMSGAEAFDVAARVAGRHFAPGRIAFAKVRGDGCVVLAFKGPRSYTGDDVVEFQCHGGAVAPRRVLEACFAAGARLARRGEFTERAFLNGKMGLEAAEAVLDLIDAKTDRAAEAALAGLGGAHGRRRRELYDAAVALSAELEHALDVDEGDLPDGAGETLRARAGALADDVAAEARRLREGRILREGALVVLAGPPNAGKSSLMNALLGANRVIVSSAPGTTRDSVEEWLDVGGWPVRLVDTAGLRETADAVEAAGVERTRALLAQADLVLLLRAEEGTVAPTLNPSSLFPNPFLLVHSKCDLGRAEGALNVSAVTGEGLEELKAAIAAWLEAKADGSRDEGDGSGADATASGLAAALSALRETADAPDLVVMGNAVRHAAAHLGALVGAEYTTDLLDRLFSRFCVGK